MGIEAGRGCRAVTESGERESGMRETELLSAMATHEWARMEWKESFGAECIETACAFANAAGGYIVPGRPGKRRQE